MTGAQRGSFALRGLDSECPSRSDCEILRTMNARIYRRWLLLLPLAFALIGNSVAQKPDAGRELTSEVRRGREGGQAAERGGTSASPSPDSAQNVRSNSAASPVLSSPSGGKASGPAPTGLPPLPSAIQQPTLPQAFVDTTYPTVTGTSRPVHSGDNLQTVLNAAQCGDEVVIDAGAAFTGNFVVPATICTAAHQILVRSSAISSLPAGVRVQPSQANLMPK